MPSPTTTRGLLGIFPRGADPTANNPHANNQPVRSPTSSSLRAIFAAGAGGRSARGEASGRRGPWEEGRSGKRGEAESEGLSGGSNATSDADMEEEGWGQDTLMVLPWGTQESGARGLQVDAQAGGSDGRKAPSVTAEEAGTGDRHGARQEQREENGGRWEWEGGKPSGVGGGLGAARPPE